MIEHAIQSVCSCIGRLTDAYFSKKVRNLRGQTVVFVSMICNPLAERSERVGEESLVAFAVFLLENFVGRGGGRAD